MTDMGETPNEFRNQVEDRLASMREIMKFMEMDTQRAHMRVMRMSLALSGMFVVLVIIAGWHFTSENALKWQIINIQKQREGESGIVSGLESQINELKSQLKSMEQKNDTYPPRAESNQFRNKANSFDSKSQGANTNDVKNE